MIHINVVGENKINCFIIILLISMLFVSEIKAQIEKDSINTILENYLDKDQGIRRIFSEVYKKYGEGSIDLQKIGTEMAQQDSINQNVVLPLLDRYGWFDGLSNKAGQCYFYVIQHSNKDIMNKYQDSIKIGYCKNYISAQEYAYFMDRLSVSNNCYQLYGTQQVTKSFSITNNYKYIYPIINISNLDNRRYSLGLEPIYDKLKSEFVISNIDYNKDCIVLIINIIKSNGAESLPGIQVFIFGEYYGKTNENGYLETYIEKAKLSNMTSLSLLLRKDVVYEKNILLNLNNDQDFFDINVSLNINNRK